MLFPMSFQPQTFAQSNPALVGLQTGMAMRAQAIQNQMSQAKADILPQSLQQQLQSQELANQLATINNQYQPGMLQSRMGLYNAQANAQNSIPGLNQAQAQEALARGGMYGAQANLVRAQTPYLVEQAQGGVYNDPLLKRGYELGQAQQTGAISPQYLSMLGLGPVADANTPPPQGAAPVGQSPMAMQNGMGNAPMGMGASPNMSPMPGTPLSNLAPGGGLQQFIGAPGSQPITAPNVFSGNPAENWALFGSPLSPIVMQQLGAYGKGLDTQATSQVSTYNDLQKQAATQGDAANQTSNLMDQFLNNYKKTDLTGPLLGHLPAVTSASQAADNATNNAAALVAKALGGNRVTNYEMQYVGNLKPNRAMTPQTAQTVADFLKQKSLRYEEEQNFMSTARSQGVMPQTAQTLWQNYNNQRPVYNFQTNTPNTQFQKSWQNYLTPQAINAVQSGQNYVPLPSFSNKTDFHSWLKTIPPSDAQTVMAELAQGGKR